MIGQPFAIQPLSIQSHYTYQEHRSSPERKQLQSQIESRINNMKIFSSGRKKRLTLRTQNAETRAQQSTGVSQMTYTPVSQMNKTAILSFSNMPLSQQAGRRRSLMHYTQRAASPVKCFVAY